MVGLEGVSHQVSHQSTLDQIPCRLKPLLTCRRQEEAVEAAATLFKTPTNNFDAEDYCAKLALAFEEEKQLSSSTGWMDLARQPDLRRVLIAVGVQSLQQAQGSSYMTT